MSDNIYKTIIALKAIGKDPLCTQEDIKKALDKAFPNKTSVQRISGILVVLNEFGLIEVNRKNKYELTSSGEKLLERIEKEALDEIFKI